MNLFSVLNKSYMVDRLSAQDAQRCAEFITFGPIVFQVSRLMLKFGIFSLLRESDKGLTQKEISERTKLSLYAIKVLTEASLTIGSILIDQKSDRFTLSKVGWFLLTDPLVRINFDFNQDVNYLGMFYLEESLIKKQPKGLKQFGNWSTIYEGLSELPQKIQNSWFAFDHFYSDSSFDEALKIVFRTSPRNILDVGGNTGKWALQCVKYNEEVVVTIMDLPMQLDVMRRVISSEQDSNRIEEFAIDLLDTHQSFPKDKTYDVIWMSQFLDCFSEDEIVSILSRTKEIMKIDTNLYIMETFWDRQKYDTAAFCITQISLYFAAIANGNSKMYHSDDMQRLIKRAGLKVDKIYDYIGYGHSIIQCTIV